MRILGFSKKWDKLSSQTFTTFRYPRLDRDWEVDEEVQIVISPRSKNRERLGKASILSKERRELDKKYAAMARTFPLVTDEEAREDGFADLSDMFSWMEKTYGRLDFIPVMNKLTLSWCGVHNE